MSNADEFARQLGRELDEHVRRNMDLMTRKMGLQALNGVTMLSPVKTSRLKGNWQLNLDGAFMPLERFGGAAGSPATGEQVAEANSALSSRRDPFASIFIGNGLDYASYVNDGTPKMPARPMVEPTVESINRQFARVKAE